jgi:MFS family permease
MNEKNKKWILTACYLGLFELMFINAMGNIVGPQIVSDLKDTSAYAFMYTLNFLCSSIALPISTMIGHKTGRKLMIAAGVIMYGLGAALAGTSTNMTIHMVMRGLQGAGNGTILGNVLAFFGESLDAEGRGKAMGLYGTLTGIVYLVAPLFGGVIGDFLGWRMVFYLSIPLTVITLAILLLKMPTIKVEADAKLDWKGTLLLSGVTIGVVMVFSWGGQKYAWFSAPVLLMMAMFVICLFLFVYHINHADAPVFSPDLFKNREFRLIIGGVCLIGPTLYAIGAYIAMQSMAICGTTATTAGVITAAKSAVQLVLGYFLGAYIGKTGKIKPIMILTSVVYTVSNIIIGLISGPEDLVLFIIGILLSGLGTTTYSMVYTLHAQNELPERLIGEATSAIQFLQSLSGTIGLSLVGMVLNISFQANLAQTIPDGLNTVLTEEQINSYLGTTLLTDQTQLASLLAETDASGQALINQFVTNLRLAYAGALRNAMFVLAALAAITIIFSMMVKSSKKAEA